MESHTLIYTALILLVLSVILFLFYIYRRIRWLVNSFTGATKKKLKVQHSITKLAGILVLTGSAITLLFAAFFMQAYHSLTREIPVAEVRVRPDDATDSFTLILLLNKYEQETEKSQYIIHGDQWMIEADIIKWDNWLNFTGLETRYRLTRIRGRYRTSVSEKTKPASVYALDPLEDNPLWRSLYTIGHQLPFISAVYGNAAYQDGHKKRNYLVFVSTSGLVIRVKN